MKFGPFLGLNNLLPDTQLMVKDKGQYLRQAINVDLNDAGLLSRRKGQTLVSALTAPHSLWSDGLRTLFVQGGNLREITDFDTFTSSSVMALTSNSRMAYEAVNGHIYFSNGTDQGRLMSGESTATPWALATPANPTIAVISGALNPGIYQIAISYARSNGEQSGTSEYQAVELSSAGAFHLTLPGSVPGADFINLYLSGANGEVPLYHSQVAVGTPTATLTTPPTGHSAPHPFMQPQPAGQCLALHNGRLLSAVGPLLTYSPAYAPGLYIPFSDYIPFPDDITNIAPVPGGVFVTADKTYWLEGADISQAQVRVRLPFGASLGTFFRDPAAQRVGWYGDSGLVTSDEAGQIKEVQASALAVDVAAAGAVLVREEDGTRMLVVCLGTAKTPALADPTVAVEDGNRVHGA